MLLVSLFELVPEAVGHAGKGFTLAAVVLGILILAALHWIIPHTQLFVLGAVISSFVFILLTELLT
ncbi:MAG: hypothetical protein GY792_29020 [Gammaproteobacteria bacterium]|nr:hypothetical protein [Gammaproteobacteria bacterium]